MASCIHDSPRVALNGLSFDGMMIMSGGFGFSGNPGKPNPQTGTYGGPAPAVERV